MRVKLNKFQMRKFAKLKRKMLLIMTMNHLSKDSLLKKSHPTKNQNPRKQVNSLLIKNKTKTKSLQKILILNHLMINFSAKDSIRMHLINISSLMTSFPNPINRKQSMRKSPPFKILKSSKKYCSTNKYQINLNSILKSLLLSHQ